MNNLLGKIDQLLRSEHLPENLQRLFCETLHWGLPKGMPQRQLSVGAPFNATLTVHPIAQLAGLPVFRVGLPNDRLPGITARRAVQRALKPIHAEHLVCYVTQDQKQAAFVWARARADGKTELRTLPYEVGSPARTTVEQFAKLAFTLDELGLTGQPPITAVTDKLNRAFSVEAVTERFFEDYKKVFADLQARLHKISGDLKWAHDYALQLLNRLMFLYFIQRKRFADGEYWLGDDRAFLRNFWQAYKNSRRPPDTFFVEWLSVLFFEAFNNRFHGGYRYFPHPLQTALQLAPYLNGGLFTRNRLDEQTLSLTLQDEFFTQLFDEFNGSTPGFLERYNFTIAESTPLDIEVAVDPEMIGKVYESLVNLTSEGLSEEDRRGTAGIFYTPRVEIDLMCRLAVADALSNQLEDKRQMAVRPYLYAWVFAAEPEEKERADKRITDENLWEPLYQAVTTLTVCDPACGSGSFLVGMLLVLDDLQGRANTQLGIKESPYQRRRRIIGQQLYGVDVMDWAVHVAELRLWLQLTVETDLKKAEAHLEPLLPNLTFKLRQGDGLVQEIGGINFGLHRYHLDIPAHLKGRITQLKGKKLRFYQGESGLRESDLKKEELTLFRDILTQKHHTLQNEITSLSRQLEQPPKQEELPGMVSGKVPQKLLKLQEQWRTERDEKQAELDRLKQALEAFRTARDVPFVWDIAFVEIFEGDKAGFDIVIGNPPYVRQELITPPTLDPAEFGGETSDRWKEQKKAYKAKLQESVAAAWPKFFRYKPGRADFRKPDGKSDLYIYFYLHGLSLLNPRGSFCFITSNSWLDVGYGKDLQEFLLKHSHVKFILDNERKRSFAQADVNTIIALLTPPDDRTDGGLEKTARFVMFKVPFEEVLSAETFKALEAATKRQSTDRWRISVISQRALLEEGVAADEDEKETAKPHHRRGPLIKTARYEANKWGGKYLRAPDIFFTILEKGKGKLVRLGDIAEVRFGIKTGANEFFYLDDEKIRHWGIEPEFLKPVIKSPRECRSIVIKPEDLRYKIFMCHKDKSELKGTAALEYIKWGESQKFHLRPSCRGRQRWWDVGKRCAPQIVSPSSTSDLYRTFVNRKKVLIDKRLYELFVDSGLVERLATAMNSTITTLFLELGSRTGLGEGLLDLTVYEVADCMIVNASLLERPALFGRDILGFEDEISQPDRRALDEMVFDVLGLTAGEREAVYEAVVNLVRARLEKARSVE